MKSIQVSRLKMTTISTIQEIKEQLSVEYDCHSKNFSNILLDRLNEYLLAPIEMQGCTVSGPRNSLIMALNEVYPTFNIDI